MARKRKDRVAPIIREVKAKRRQFLKDISALLSDAIGFQVRVSPVRVVPAVEPMPPGIRRAARSTKAQTRKKVQEAFAPMDAKPGEIFNLGE